MQVHARVRWCTRLLRAVPQTEVRRAPEQVQIELNLIPHCAATGTELRNCTLMEDRTARLPDCFFPFSPPLDFLLSLSLCVLILNSLHGPLGMTASSSSFPSSSTSTGSF